MNSGRKRAHLESNHKFLHQTVPLLSLKTQNNKETDFTFYTGFAGSQEGVRKKKANEGKNLKKTIRSKFRAGRKSFL
ncbi:MAG: hypothetical protein FWD31_13950, partial [Planctomycetaceae bacterium]|nr:hypothetical protein [Planctomycetaceae bacterium]